MTPDHRRQNVELILITLFDAHSRVQKDLKRVIESTEPNSEAREAAMSARDKASSRIAEAAVDGVTHEMDMLVEDESLSTALYNYPSVEITEDFTGPVLHSDAVPGNYVRYYREDKEMIEGEIKSRKNNIISVDDPDHSSEVTDNIDAVYEFEII